MREVIRTSGEGKRESERADAASALALASKTRGAEWKTGFKYRKRRVKCGDIFLLFCILLMLVFIG